MRTVHCPGLGRDVSALGFGCASLGSRVSAHQGRRAIARALDLGLSWFDVAPPYGDGQAEALLGGALRGVRDRVVICTKFGIAAPDVPLAARLVRPLARQAVAAFPALRAVAARSRPVGRRAPIDPATIEASVIASLRRLGIDYIDVLAIHEPSLQDAANPAIFEVLDRLRERKLVRAIAMAGSPDCIGTAIAGGRHLDVLQFPDTPLTQSAAALRAQLRSSRPMFVTHGAFGSSLTAAVANLDVDQRNGLSRTAADHGLDVVSPEDVVLPSAFANNPDGVVLVSMFALHHIERNVAAANRRPTPALADAVRRVLAAPSLRNTPP